VPAGYPSPALEIPPSPAVPPVASSRTTNEQFGPAGSRTNSNAGSSATPQPPAIQGFPVIPPPPAGFGSNGPIVPIAGQEPLKNPATSPMAPTTTTLPALPIPSGNQTSTSGTTLPLPQIEMGPKPPPPGITSSTTTSPNIIPPPGAIAPPSISVVSPDSSMLPKLPGNSTVSPGNAGTSGTTLHITKPPSSPPPPSNIAIERSPTTSYDVDLYEPKQGDTYESISREFYNDVKYAAALKAVNSNKPLSSGGTVDIPPLYILKQKFQAPSRTGIPSSQSSPTPISAPTWGPPATATTPTPPSGGNQIYRVSVVTTMRDLAKNYLGNDQRWMEIYNLNPHLAPDKIPAGTEVQLPKDARIPPN